jgi:hypothetical protein
MPSTLAHIAVQGILTRPAFPRLAARWILLGAVLPDVPWILKRITRVTVPSLDPYDVRLYFLIQASLVFCLLLAGALAALSWRPRLTFACLAASSLLHLLTDAVEIKWGVGVHLLAPVRWRGLNFGLVWPESLAPLLLTLLGVVMAFVEWRRPPDGGPRGTIPGRKWATAVALAGAYLLLPLAFMPAAEKADIHMVGTLRDVSSRPGKSVELDRVVYHPEDGGYVKIFSRERLKVVGPLPDEVSVVSIRGRFLDAQTVEVRRLHRHSPLWRDVASYAGLLLVALIWVRDWLRRRGDRSVPPRVAIPPAEP